MRIALSVLALPLLLLPSFSSYDPATTEIYTLSLHDALPIYRTAPAVGSSRAAGRPACVGRRVAPAGSAGAAAVDRKSTRLNSSHVRISYAVFCLKKKNT